MRRFIALLTTCITNMLLIATLQAQSGLSVGGERPLQGEDVLQLTRDDFREAIQSGDNMGRQVQSDAPYQAISNINARTTACASAFNLGTPYNSNNGQRGCMFDVYATNEVTIRCFEANLYAGTTADYEIYYRPGTHVGNENNSVAWTFLGGATGITSAGTNVPTALPITVNVTIPAGQTYSFYVTNTFGGGTSYTDGTAVGNFLAADANLTVYEGVGKSYPFGLTFTVRNFNGTIFYDLGGALDAEDALLMAESKNQSVELIWAIGPGRQFKDLHVERSLDGHKFEDIARPGTNAPTQHYNDRSLPGGGHYYYRLRLLDAEGQSQYSNIAEVQVEGGADFSVEFVYPNPFSDALHIQLYSAAGVEIRFRLMSALGQEVYRGVQKVEAGQQDIGLQPGDLPRGMYLLYIERGNTRQVSKLIRQ